MNSVEDRRNAVMREFIDNEVKQIQTKRRNYHAKEIKGRAKDLCDRLKKFADNEATAYQLVDDALKYLAFYLADSGMRAKAMDVGIMQFTYRRECGKALRLKVGIVGILLSWAGWFSTTWPRFMMFVIGSWLGFTVIFGVISLISTATVGQSAIIRNTGQPLEWYYYPYFSAVTLTTLGYGDIRPNTTCLWGVISSFFAYLEAFLGYVILGMLIHILLKRGKMYPFARVSKWFDEYDSKVLGHKKPPPLMPYDNWKGYP